MDSGTKLLEVAPCQPKHLLGNIQLNGRGEEKGGRQGIEGAKEFNSEDDSFPTTNPGIKVQVRLSR